MVAGGGGFLRAKPALSLDGVGIILSRKAEAAFDSVNPR
jgi:hypothetical protein